MATEFRRGFVRIISNYARLLTTLVLGLVAVPILLRGLGVTGFGVVSLLGASVGLAGFFRELTNRSMVRELGAAYHDPGPLAFERAFNSACVLSLGVTAVTVCAFGVVVAIFPVLNIPEHLAGPAFWFLLAQGLTATVSVLLSPLFNMYIVKERFVAYNLLFTLQRASFAFAAILLILTVGPGHPERFLLLFGVLWSGIDIALQVGACAVIVLGDRRLIPRRSLMSVESVRAIAGTFGWNTGVYASFGLHERVPPLILNLAFDAVANTVWGVAFRFVSYVRMATMGMQFGADMVSARLSIGDEEAARIAVRNLLRVQTRLNALIAMPVGLVMLVLTEPMLRLWVGGQLEGAGEVFDQVVLTTRILAIAVITRAVSEAWMTVLYGAGHVHRYAPIVLLGGILNPITALVLIAVLPEPARLYGPAIAFAGILSLVNMIALPVVGSRVLRISGWRVILPMWRPTAATAVAAPTLAGYWLIAWPNDLVALVAVTGALALVYAALTWGFVLNAAERARFVRPFARAMGRRAQSVGAVSGASESSTSTEV